MLPNIFTVLRQVPYMLLLLMGLGLALVDVRLLEQFCFDRSCLEYPHNGFGAWARSITQVNN